MFVNVGFPSTSFGVYQPYIVAVPGMSHADGSIVVTVRNFVSLITIFFIAWYYRKLDCRMGIFLGTLATAIGFGIFAISYNVTTFIIASVVSGIGYGFAGTSAMTILIARWHEKDTGTPFGIATIGSSVAGACVPMVVLSILSTGELFQAFGVQAIFALITAFVLLIFVRNSKDGKKTKDQLKLMRNANFKLPKAKYYLYVFGVFILGGACLSDIVYLSVLFTTSGADPVLAAAVVSVANFSLAFGKIVLGYLLDKLGTLKGTIFAFVILFSGKFLICFAAGWTGIFPYISTAIFGFGTAITTVGIAQWSVDLSIPESRYNCVRDLQVAYTGGGFLTGMIPGIVAEFTGSYVPFYFASAVAVLISAIIIIKLIPRK